MFILKIEISEKAEKHSRKAPQDIWNRYRVIKPL